MQLLWVPSESWPCSSGGRGQAPSSWVQPDVCISSQVCVWWSHIGSLNWSRWYYLYDGNPPPPSPPPPAHAGEVVVKPLGTCLCLSPASV